MPSEEVAEYKEPAYSSSSLGRDMSSVAVADEIRNALPRLL